MTDSTETGRDPNVALAALSFVNAGLEADRLRAILNSMPQMVWSTQPDGYHDFFNDRWYEFTGMPVGTTDGEAWNGMFHPDDQCRAWSVWRDSLSSGRPYEIEYRLRHHSGEYRWTLGRALPMRNDRGRIERWFGTCTDIDDLKQAEDARQLVSEELSHRIKNIFAVIASLINLSAREHPGAEAFAETIMNRIGALGRAHDYVRPHSEASAPDDRNNLSGLIRTLIEPYQVQGQGRILVSGDDAEVGVRAATALALVLHELATNAVKYGALSVADGHVELACTCAGNAVTLMWREVGGPRIAGPPKRQGFGTDMAQRAAQVQLRATIANNWLPTGLEVTLQLPRDSLTR